jgi:hypothetical protein
MSFKVNIAEVHALGKGFQALRDTAQYAYFNANVDMDINSVGGRAFEAIVSEVNSVRDDLVAAYEPGGDVRRLFGGAGKALIAVADDYRSVDANARSRIDGAVKGADEVPVPLTSDEKGVDVGEYADEYAPIETPEGVKQMAEALGLTLADRYGQADDAFEGYYDFVSIAEDIDYVIGFDWVGDVLGGIGIPDPIQGFKDQLEGDWTMIGRALGALELIQSQERDFASDLDGMIKYLEGVWEGNAANSCKSWIAATGDKISGHASDLGSIGSRIKSEAMTIKSLLATICTAIDMVVDLIPDPSDLGDSLLNGIKNVVKEGIDKIIEAITKILDTFKLAFDAIMTCAFAIVTLFAQLTRFAHSEWPKTPGLDAPDVNGAKR